MNHASTVTGSGATTTGSSSAYGPSPPAGASPVSPSQRFLADAANQAASNGTVPSAADRQKVAKTAWAKVRDGIAEHPAVSLAIGFTLGGLVGWLTSKLK